MLGVENSITGKRWLAREIDERTAQALAQRLGLPEILGRVLAGRGVGLEDGESFLEPTLKRLLPDPSRLVDMDLACARLVKAVTQKESIVVFGDYDVDGATSAALLFRFLKSVGAVVGIYVPDRLKEGYGPNAAALARLREEGASLVVTVDCGTSAFEPLAAAAGAGLDVIVVDHHEAEPRLPDAIAVVNPNRLDEDGAHGQLAAVGVVFLLAVGLNRALRQAGWYGDRDEPDLMRWLDLVALGTICDVVPLTGLNRALVVQGLKVMAGRSNAGLKALADLAGINQPPGAYHAGFVLGPRINAGGRVGAADLGARLLATDDVSEAEEIARRLDQFNRERQEIEASVLADALSMARAKGVESDPLVLVAGEGWHQGVVGIVASRLKDAYDRPALVVSLQGGLGSGSGRSVRGVDLGAAIIAARQAGLLVKGGGHAMAAGFTVEREKLADFHAFMTDRVEGDLADKPRVPSISLDGSLTPGGATIELAELLDRAGPFGAGNPEPRFALSRVRVAHAQPVGDGHLRCRLEGEGGQRLEAMSFRCLDGKLGQELMGSAGAALHVAGRLRVNRWQGRVSPQLMIDDAAKPWG